MRQTDDDTKNSLTKWISMLRVSKSFNVTIFSMNILYVLSYDGCSNLILLVSILSYILLYPLTFFIDFFSFHSFIYLINLKNILMHFKISHGLLDSRRFHKRFFQITHSVFSANLTKTSVPVHCLSIAITNT